MNIRMYDYTDGIYIGRVYCKCSKFLFKYRGNKIEIGKIKTEVDLSKEILILTCPECGEKTEIPLIPRKKK